MPNTLAHFGVQGPLGRILFRDVAPEWILLGAVLPDVPWILQRLHGMLGLGLDPWSLRVHAIAQASLALTLLVCAAVALPAREPGRVFGVLALGAVLHLLLDACETKWANGVHLLAPFSWRLVNFGWVWPESPLIHALTVGGLLYGAWEWRRRGGSSARLARPRAARLGASAALIAVYFALPLALTGAVVRSDSHFVATLRRGEPRVGRAVEFDRATLRAHPAGTSVRSLAGEELVIAAGAPPVGEVASLRAVFVDQRTIEVRERHLHQGRLRDVGSYVGLLVLAAFWLPLRRGARRRRG